MKGNVELLGPGRARLSVEVPFAQRPDPAALLTGGVGDQAAALLAGVVREHDLKVLGRPEIEISELGDGRAVRFAALVDLRPEIDLPDLSSITVQIAAIAVEDRDIDEHIDDMRRQKARFTDVRRPAAAGDVVSLDLHATVDGADVERGRAEDVQHEVGTDHPLPGLDAAVTGLGPGQSATIRTRLVGGESGGRQADLAISVTSVSQPGLPELDDEFALAAGAATVEELRAQVRERLTRAMGVRLRREARAEALAALVAATGVAAPAGIVRDEVEDGKRSLLAELGSIGASLSDYLAVDGKSEEELDAELAEAARRRACAWLVLDAVADAEDIEVGADELEQSLTHRAAQLTITPRALLDRLVEEGTSELWRDELRRAKALRVLMSRVRLTDAGGAVVTFEELVGSQEAGTGGTLGEQG